MGASKRDMRLRVCVWGVGDWEGRQRDRERGRRCNATIPAPSGAYFAFGHVVRFCLLSSFGCVDVLMCQCWLLGVGVGWILWCLYLLTLTLFLFFVWVFLRLSCTHTHTQIERGRAPSHFMLPWLDCSLFLVPLNKALAWRWDWIPFVEWASTVPRLECKTNGYAEQTLFIFLYFRCGTHSTSSFSHLKPPSCASSLPLFVDCIKPSSTSPNLHFLFFTLRSSLILPSPLLPSTHYHHGQALRSLDPDRYSGECPRPNLVSSSLFSPTWVCLLTTYFCSLITFF